MFEAYNAAMRLSKLQSPAYSFAMAAQRLGFGKIITLANSLQPDDGLTYVQRLFREHSKNKNRYHGQHRQPNQDGAGTDNQQEHTEGKRHLMPEQWYSWPLRAVEPRVLDPGDPLGEPVPNPIGD